MRAVLRVVVVLLGVAALLWLAWASRGIVLWVLVAAFLATAINPLVGLLQRRGRLPRAAAIGVVYLLGLAAAAGIVYIFIPPLIEAGQGLAQDVPGYVDQLSNSRLVQDLDEDYQLLERVEEGITDQLESLAGPGTAVEITQTVLNGLIALISIAVIAFLLCLYAPHARTWGLAQLPGGQRERAERVLDRMYQVIAGYVVGTACVAAMGAAAVYLFLTIAGVPFALLLAFWVGLAALVPLVGATIGGVPYVTVAFFESWPLGVAALVYLLVYQQVENNLIQPFIHRRTVQLNALWIILAVLVGAQLLGIVGALVAIPVAGIAQVLLQEWWRSRRTRGAPAAAP